MKNRFLCFMVCFTVMAYACNSSKSSSTHQQAATVVADDISGKRWKLTELYGKPVADSINGKEPFLQFKKNDSSYSGNAGCNGIGGNYTLARGNRIKFKPGMSTMMFCNQMEIENDLKKVLEQADNYSINGNELTLNKARMAPLARFREVAVAGATLNGTWELNYISGARIAFEGLYPNKKPTITFNVAENKANGNSGCNNYNVSFTVNGNSIQFGDAMSTKMACEGGGESAFFSTLKKITSYNVNNNTLNLVMGDIAMMRFEKK